MQPNPHQTTTSQAADHQGSFLTGFGIGLLAGAMGFFLFATDEGEKLKDELYHEWQQAKTATQQQNWWQEIKQNVAGATASQGLMNLRAIGQHFLSQLGLDLASHQPAPPKTKHKMIPPPAVAEDQLERATPTPVVKSQPVQTTQPAPTTDKTETIPENKKAKPKATRKPASPAASKPLKFKNL